MLKLSPYNLKAWVDEHRDLLKPPVGNAEIMCPLDEGLLTLSRVSWSNSYSLGDSLL